MAVRRPKIRCIGTLVVAICAWVVGSTCVAAGTAPRTAAHTTLDLAAPDHHVRHAVARPLRNLVPSPAAPTVVRDVPLSAITALSGVDVAALLYGPPRYTRLRVLRL